MPVDLPRRTFNVDEYYKMADAGIFERERVELVEGEVVAMTPMGSRHAACVSRLQDLLIRLLGAGALVRVQQPLRISDRTELEPDVAVVGYRSDYYAHAHPKPEDTHLVVEVADSSSAYDRDVKMPIYARAGVPVAWLVDLTRQLVTVLGQPTPEGYLRQVDKSRGEELELVIGELSIRLRVDDLLP